MYRIRRGPKLHERRSFLSDAGVSAAGWTGGDLGGEELQAGAGGATGRRTI